MARDDDRSEWLLGQMGSALVAWSEVEKEWFLIFERLLFEGRYKRFPLPPADDEISPEEQRAAAVWDTITSSKAQIDIVKRLAPLVLASESQRESLRRLLSAINATNEARAWRNAIAHGALEWEWPSSTSEDGRRVFEKPRLVPVNKQRNRLVGKDPYEEVPRMRQTFGELRAEVSAIRFRLTTGQWPAGWERLDKSD